MKQESLGLLDANLQDVAELLEIPKLIPGRRDKILQINKAAIVLITASFESFVETLAENALDFMIESCQKPDDIPEKIRNLVGSRYTNSPNPAMPWTFAGDGWRSILLKYREEVVRKYTGSFNTASPENIDNLFAELIGIKNISTCWSFQPKRYNTIDIYRRFLVDRHKIAHKNEGPAAPSIFYARRYKDLVETIAAQTAEAVERHLLQLSK